tara:strand:+ start:244 stop:438 length:195 start_codon:yes stop_codon:yes gene_type:complete
MRFLLKFYHACAVHGGGRTSSGDVFLPFKGIAQETIQLGACDYIVKPFRFEQLETHLAMCLLMN